MSLNSASLRLSRYWRVLSLRRHQLGTRRPRACCPNRCCAEPRRIGLPRRTTERQRRNAMRRRLNIDAASARSRESISSRAVRRRPRSRFHGSAANFRWPKKEKPGGGNAGSDFFVIGVYGFKYAAWLCSCRSRAVNQFCFLVQPNFFSSSSLFLFFDFVSKFNRSLCEFASISVGLRTHSSLGGDGSRVARAMPPRFFLMESVSLLFEAADFTSDLDRLFVKGIDNDVT